MIVGEYKRAQTLCDIGIDSHLRRSDGGRLVRQDDDDGQRWEEKGEEEIDVEGGEATTGDNDLMKTLSLLLYSSLFLSC